MRAQDKSSGGSKTHRLQVQPDTVLHLVMTCDELSSDGSEGFLPVKVVLG